MLCPFATQRPVSAHGGSMATHLGVVIHVTAGEGDPFNEFANPANQVSSHFGIGNGQGGMLDGSLEQYVDTDLDSWAQAAGNGSYVSVETEGEPTELLTPAQVATFGRLMAWLHQVHGVLLSITDTPGAPGFITHGDGGASWGGHEGCPGPLRSAQRQAIIAAAGTVPTPTPQEDDDMGFIATDPESGKVIATDPDGNFYADPGIGDIVITTLGQHPQWRAGNAESGGQNPCVGVTPWKDPGGRWGYAFITKPAGGHGALGPFTDYHIGRDGTPH